MQKTITSFFIILTLSLPLLAESGKKVFETYCWGCKTFYESVWRKEGKPVGLLFWKYEKLLSDTRISAGKRRVESYTIQESEKLKYPLTAVVKLNFRIYPQWVTDAVKKMYPQLPDPPVVVLEKIIKKFPKK